MRKSSRDLGAAILALAVAAGVYAISLTTRSADTTPETAQVTSYRVIDGDTIEDTRSGERIRLVNVDTPETGERAACAAENALGLQATQRTQALISSAARLDIRRSGRIDAYGRAVARVLVDGRDLGEVLIAEGVARAWRGRREPWCDARGRLIPASQLAR